MDKKFEILKREHGDAIEADKLATQIKKDDPGLSSDDAADEAIIEIAREKKRTSSGYDQLNKEKEESSWLKSCFYLTEWKRNTKYKSEDLWKAVTEMWIMTGIYQQSHVLDKHLIAIEIGDKIEESEIKNLPVYYLGASRDFHFPLALRFRNIVMVDGCYDREFLDEMAEQLAEFSDFRVISRQGNTTKFGFNFDFGNGKKEPVEITFIQDNVYNLPEPEEEIGAILSYFSGPSTAPAFYQRNLQKKLAKGGIVFETDDSPLYSLAIERYGEEIFGDHSDEKYHRDYKRKVEKLHDKEAELAKNYGFNVRKLPGTPYRLFTKIQNSVEWLDLLDQALREESKPLNIPNAKDLD